MSARVGMGTLIALLRAACNAGTADYAVAGVTYWTDDQLQAELDRDQQEYHSLFLDRNPVIEQNSWKWYDYFIPETVGDWIEQDATGSGWAVKTANGGTVANNLYTVNYEAGRISFTADQGGTVYFLDVRSYSLYRAASRIWRNKAVNIANQVNWSSDNHRIDASQKYDHYMEQSRHYASLAGPNASKFMRTDEL